MNLIIETYSDPRSRCFQPSVLPDLINRILSRTPHVFNAARRRHPRHTHTSTDTRTSTPPNPTPPPPSQHHRGATRNPPSTFAATKHTLDVNGVLSDTKAARNNTKKKKRDPSRSREDPAADVVDTGTARQPAQHQHRHQHHHHHHRSPPPPQASILQPLSSQPPPTHAPTPTPTYSPLPTNPPRTVAPNPWFLRYIPLPPTLSITRSSSSSSITRCSPAPAAAPKLRHSEHAPPTHPRKQTRLRFDV